MSHWTDVINEEDFEDILNESTEDVNVLGVYYPQGYLLKKTDYDRFREIYKDFCQSTLEEMEYENEISTKRNNGT
jgi:hypothetical protein